MAIRWLENVSDGEERDVGKKASSLATLSEYGLDTPRGFVVTAQTFEEFVRQNGLENQIESILNNADRTDINSLKRAENRIQNLILNADVAGSIRDEIEEAYEKINMSEEVRNAGGEAVDLVGGQRETEFVAVRSSPTGSRFPGAHKSEMNVNGKSSVITQIKQCWSSLYSAEALRIEEETRTIHSMAVVVQRMVEPDVSGSIFGKNPVTARDSGYVIESLWGLGTGLYDGSLTPDRFVIDVDGNVTQQDIVNKEWRIVRDPTSGKNIKQRVSTEDRESRSLQPGEMNKVVDMIKTVEDRFGKTIRLDFVFSRNRLYVLDMEQVVYNNNDQNAEADSTRHRDSRRRNSRDTDSESFLSGREASAGRAAGTARILYSDTDIERVDDQDVLVSVNASERMMPVLPQVVGVVTDKGGLSSNLVAVARMLGVPTIVGTTNGTDMLTQDEEISLDGGDGVVRKGDAMGRNGHERTMEKDTVSHQPVEDIHDTGTGSLTATRVKVLGQSQSAAADGAVIVDYADSRRIADVADAFHPERVWARTDNPELSDRKNVGILTQHIHTDMQEKGAILSSFGGVMQSTNLLDRGAQFVGLDIDALQSDGDREALLNAIQKIGEETSSTCESSLILRSLDPEVISAAVESGIDSITVPEEHVPAARRQIAKEERRFMLQKLRQL